MALMRWSLQLLLLLQLVSHALCQSNTLPYFDDDYVTVNVLEDHNTSLPLLASPYSATDDDGDNITYSLPGLGADNFYITQSENGFNIYFSGMNIDREFRDNYDVEISADDNMDHGNAELAIVTFTFNILDVNDNAPEFTNLPSTVSFDESTNIGVELFHIEATDKDVGKNKRIKYTIISVSPSSGQDKFSIPSGTSGRVILSNSLDYEKVKQFKLTIRAKDHGDVPLQEESVLTINVTDVNDNDPAFTQVLYTAQIYENLTNMSTILQVEAYDQDTMLDYDIVYSIDGVAPPSGEDFFAIDDETGVLYVDSDLEVDFGSPQQYTVTIRGQEVVSPFRYNTTMATITILDVNDNPPVFVEANYNSSISESSNIGLTVVSVRATDADQGQNADFTFHLVNLLSTDSLPFNVSQGSDGETGIIQLSSTLDFENIEDYKFLVIATEVVDDKVKKASSTVTVFVTNVNDNHPVFDQTMYSVNVSENSQIDSFVGKVLAEDDDKGMFGDVSYYLGNFEDIFKINQNNGEIRLLKKLNYENVKSYALTVIAKDSTPDPADQLTSQVQMHVTVEDVNDNPPIIYVNGSDTVEEVTKSVEEQQDPGVLVFVIDAEDADEFPHNVLDYFIEVLTPSNLNSSHFEYSITAKNQLLTSIRLDYEKIEQYKLRACVSDYGDKINQVIVGSGGGSGGEVKYMSVNDLPSDHVDCIDIIVDVIDENDNAPIFIDNSDVVTDSYAFDVVEEQEAGTFVGYVNATDDDSKLFGTVEFFISGIDHENFTIDSMTGVIRTAGPIDREQKDRFDLIVTARDLDPVNPLSATATLTLTILDINDNVPTFLQPVYVRNDIVESSDMIEIQVSATDADINENQDLTYEIIEGNLDDQFIIDSGTGLIERNPLVTLDREINPVFKLIIEVTDDGDIPLSSNATLYINVQDINDNKPTFEYTVYNVSVSEGISVNSPILTVKANDPDAGSNSVVRYSIVPGGDSQAFEIGQSSGVITTNQEFDVDKVKDRYFITVEAQDNGEISQSSKVDVDITILDINDNSPSFSKVQYKKSVNEDISGGALITTVSAFDNDNSKINSQIKYSISNVETVGTVIETEEEADNTTNLFTIDEDSGEIFLADNRSLDYESVTEYSIEVKAQDGGTPPRTDSSVVRVTVLDYNDNDPMLSADSYALEIDEDTSSSTEYDIFMYSDEDSGVNAISTYTISGTSVFSIDGTTGVLTLQQSLDYDEGVQYFQFQVTVTDGGSPSLSDTSTVNVTIIDVNDNAPVFDSSIIDPVTINLAEGDYRNPLNKILYTFNASDADSGINSKLSYAISNGNLSLFSIDSVSGQFKVIGEINRENDDFYELVVTVKDGGSPSESASVSVEITITDVNEEPPMFLLDSYSETIDENNELGVSLVKVAAEDSDLGINATVTYSVNDTRFNISSDGVIETNSVFDYEKNHSINVLVTATDGGGLYSTVIFILFIDDLNDNDPVFVNTFDTPFDISEDQGVPYDVAVVSATDEDSGANGDISYSLAGTLGKFSISSSGQVTLESELDREVEDQYTMTVIAVDHGPLNQQTSNTSITVRVTDVNDETPAFEPTFYSTVRAEDTSVSATLVTVTASDGDIGSNGEITFAIISGNSAGLFAISTEFNSTSNEYQGHVTLVSALDYEMETSYSLQVTATDKGTPSALSSTAFVSIKVTNVNDQVPVFTQSGSYTFSISEIAIAGTPVGTVLATDDDEGEFGKIASYNFDTGTDTEITNNFNISTSSGVIILSNTANLDYDNGKQTYSFNVIATDGGGESSTASVVINVLDHNEDAPKFLNQSYAGNITENQPIDQFIVQVEAVDPDNAQITYSIIGGNTNNSFKIDSSGVIRNAKTLDREDMEVYVLTVQAADSDDDPLFGDTQVQITVLDVNDNSPEFPGDGTVEYQVLESAQMGTSLLLTAANDDDSGVNALIQYSAVGEGISDVFQVNVSTGEIKLVGTLNFENKTQYKFVITAKDSGEVPNSADLSVTIDVLDSNDNAPEFNSSEYTVSLSESTPEGSLVTTVSASDIDSGKNAEITYSITEPDTFEVNSDGEISLKKQLDYENVPSYSLVVTATDNGEPKKSATATVELTVIDFNDEAPVFTSSNYSYTIKEQDISTNVTLLSVNAKDEDGTSPNNLIAYNITDGNKDNKFFINDQGVLYAVKSLDYEMEQSYRLEVAAMDNPVNANQRKLSLAYVDIYVEDINDNYPVWKEAGQHRITPNQYSGTVFEDAVDGTTILFVYATDEDSGAFGKVTYSFSTPSDKFYINEMSGIIYTYGGLDVEVVDMYNLTVIATDGGMKSTTGYVIIQVKDINDKVPFFSSSFFHKEVSEDVDEDTYSVVILTAIDIDSEDLTYSILGGAQGYFYINSTTGEVGLEKELDREEVDDFLMTIFVTDGEFNDTTTLRVTVLDVNDNAPMFVDAPYHAYIPENTVEGSVLLLDNQNNATFVFAFDADEPDTPRSTVVYNIIGANDHVLNIEPLKGVLTVDSEAGLDYENSPTVVVTVEAQDSVSNPLSSTTTITIHVMDVNDVVPVFKKKDGYSESVDENEPAGTLISDTIEASDEDTGLGGVITYSIVSTNPSGYLDKFSINSTTGVVRLADSLDRENTGLITLTVRATDGGPSNYNSAEVSLEVHIIDVNDNSPVFNNTAYFVSVPESIGISVPILTVLATDEDELNINSLVDYSLLSHTDTFAINKDSGEITTAVKLDYETDNYYKIIVRACDSGAGPLCSNVTVSVQVTDINDLAPVYDYDIYYTTLCDDVTPVSTVMQVIALDGDSGDYGKVTYSLDSGSQLGDLFTLDETTGVIELVDHLTEDNTAAPVIVDIVAQDGGSPAMSATTQVQILFCQLDSAIMYFNESLYYGVVTENDMPPVNITSVTAISVYGPITYTLLPPNTDDFFEISQTGMITTNEILDREERATYTLVVKATDSAVTPNTAYATISVAVLDVNDNPPMFLLPPYMFTLVEELTNTTLHEIDSVVAIDPDKPFNPMGVTYSIESASNPNGVFTINENGTIFATKPVDREVIDEYNLKIMATDTDPSDPRVATATATITIIDINDNSPVFEAMVNYTATVSENEPPNFYVFEVSAKDIDADLRNREIVYSIYSGAEGKFFIDSTTGIIRTLTQLNYENQTSYTITVMAQDKGITPQSSFVSVYVTVEDYNDCTPMFTEDSYSTSLYENFTINDMIFDFNATDCDSGVNKEVTFEIVAGNNGGHFAIDSSSGILSLNKELNYEDKTSHSLQIKAMDGGNPAKSSLMQVFIGVMDVNDNTPTFDDGQKFSADIDEDLASGYVFHQVYASDEDATSINSALEYSLSGKNADYFDISGTGAISVKKPLDREANDSYVLTITVSDTGSPSLSAHKAFTITISDVNDNPPVIHNLSDDDAENVVNVYENAVIDTTLFIVNASDADIDDNGRLSYSLKNYENLFKIDPLQGEIKLKGQLDYDDSVTEYQLSIEVSDSGDPKLSDQATLNIRVLDVNDNSPIFIEEVYTVVRPEEEDPGQVFTTVEATDNDGTVENNNVTYQLTGCEPSCVNSFSVNPVTGEVSNTIKLDREIEDTFTLTIMGINLGADPELSDSTTVKVTITDINDHPPQFTDPGYSASIYEGIASGTSLLTVKATDSDQINTANTELSYKIVSVLQNNPFLVDEDTGVLEVAGSIDRESISFYNFTVRVEDNGAETKLHDDVQVTITVKDVNDQRPVFTSNTHSTIVNEGLGVQDLPHLLWAPSYTDEDHLPVNTHSQYQILSLYNSTSSLGSDTSLITINKTSGEIWLMSLVDFETTKELSLVFSVNNTEIGTGENCDGFDKNCTLSDVATLNIEISDFNDNVPIFQRTSYTGQISTSAVPGTQIRQVIALDKDSQNDYGEVRYKLGEGSSSKFNIISESGWVVSRGNFENDDRREFNIEIVAYDNLGNSPSWSSTVQMTITALSDFRRVMILFGLPSSAFTQDKEQMIIDLLHNLTGYTIVLEEIRSHLLADTGEVDPSQTDFIFHALDEDGNIVDYDELLQRLDVAALFNALAECRPISISSIKDEEDYPKVESIMLVLIVLCGVIIIGAFIVLVLACQQRYIALNSLYKSQLRDAFYGEPSSVTGMPSDSSGFELKGKMRSNQLYVEPYNTNFIGQDEITSSLGDLDSIEQGNPIYEERELKMEMFEVSDDETDGDLDPNDLLNEALRDDESESGSVTAI